jgi:hypothetical protein
MMASVALTVLLVPVALYITGTTAANAQDLTNPIERPPLGRAKY